jgi:hypothetical protein
MDPDGVSSVAFLFLGEFVGEEYENFPAQHVYLS